MRLFPSAVVATALLGAPALVAAEPTTPAKQPVARGRPTDRPRAPAAPTPAPDATTTPAPTAAAPATSPTPAPQAPAPTALTTETAGTPTSAPRVPRLDLTPSRLFDPGRSLAKGSKPAEDARGLTLGDDTSWKVQAAQVGVMVGVFGALVGLCGSGACALPTPDFLPDFLRSREGSSAEIDGRDAPLRSAR